MPAHELPAHPNLEYLKNQARTLLRERQAANAVATERFAALGITSAEPKLADALHVIARDYGFDSWPALKLHVELRSAEPITALIAAIEANDALRVRAVLASNPAIRARIDEPLPGYGFDEPPILSAVHKQNRDMVDALLEAGAHIDERSRWWAGGFGVLDFANSELAAYLVSRGAKIDLHAAARLGMTRRVRELLASEPHLVHARGGDGQLPLHFAATAEIAGLLLDAGADINARDIDHESTALQYSVCHQEAQQGVASYLVSRGAKADILAAVALGDLPLVERILNHDPETVRTTVTDKYFPRQNPKSGGSIYIYSFGLTTTAHMLALRFGHRDVFELLMQRSPPWLRLLQAAEMGDDVLFEKILAQHPALFARLTANAARRLIGSALRNNDGAVKLLTGAGWPVNVAMDNGQTPLHFAAWNGNCSMVTALLARGAEVNVFETEHGGSPLAWALHGSMHGWHAKTGDYAGVTRLLLNAGATLSPAEKPREATEEVLEVLRQHGL